MVLGLLPVFILKQGMSVFIQYIQAARNIRVWFFVLHRFLKGKQFSTQANNIFLYCTQTRIFF